MPQPPQDLVRTLRLARRLEIADIPLCIAAALLLRHYDVGLWWFALLVAALSVSGVVMLGPVIRHAEERARGQS